MGELFKNKKINSPIGIFFQIPVFIIAAFGLYELIEKIYFSLTQFNMLEPPSFVGFKNYLSIFKDEVILKCLGNTVIMVFIVAALLFLTAVLPAIFTARLKLPFGLVVMGAFSFISLCTMFPNSLKIFFSSDSYGTLNSILLSASLINEPILFIQTYATLFVVTVLWLHCLAPVFSITYIAARMKHSFLGSAIAVCLIPVFMYNGGGIATSIVDYPTNNYTADWLYTIFQDFLTTRHDMGLAYAILSTGLIMLVVWCVAVCVLALGLWALFKNINSNSSAFKVIGYIAFVTALPLFFLAFAFVTMYFLKALMPIEELFTFPPSIFPKRPTLQNFYDLITLMSNSAVPFLRHIINSLFVVPLLILPVCLFVALPSGIGFGLFKAFKHQKLLLLCFIPFLFAFGYLTYSRLGIIDTYTVYMLDFLSSFEFIIAVFLVYLTVKLVFYDRKPRISGILLGILFVLTSFSAIGVIRGLWYNSNGAIYNEHLKIWPYMSTVISSGGMARCGVAAANDILMLFATVTAVIIPIILAVILYVLYRKNTKNLTKIQ
ncbi:MAG: hypothetical protein J6B80_03915 [Clostridia bacterium]|nr:hypothetical protein [Clostridia bacterium]